MNPIAYAILVAAACCSLVVPEWAWVVGGLVIAGLSGVSIDRRAYLTAAVLTAGSLWCWFVVIVGRG